jgi:group I intron endonuclease
MCGIYKIENLINGKIYIGQSVDIQYRFRNHKSESFNPKSNAYDTAIHRAIRKYGVDNFSFDVVEECDQDELREREIYWINYYNSFGVGYNLTSGGEGVPTINIKQVQKLWDDGLSIKEIAQALNCNQHTAIHILESYKNYNSQESYKRGRKNARKKMNKSILQYDLHGVFVQKHESIAAASVATNIKRSNISSALTGKVLSAGGYQWVYEGNNPPGTYDPKSFNDKKPVLQFDLYGNFIAEYSSATEAAKAVGLKYINSITKCCNNKQHTAGGYCWKWKSE